MQTTKKRSRFSDAPSRETLVLQERDLEICRLLNPERRYSYLTGPWIAALLDFSWPTVRDRFGRLWLKPHKILDRPPQQNAFNGLGKSCVYSLGVGGVALLLEARDIARAPKKRPGHFYHELMLDLVDAQIELASARDPLMEQLRWTEILRHPATPEAMRATTDPFRILTHEGLLIPDGRPFVLRHKHKGAIAFFKEIDCATEQIRLTATKHNTFTHKLRRYKDMFQRKLYREKYGFPAAMVLIVSTNARHLDSIQHAVGKIIGDKVSWLLFRHVPNYCLKGMSIPVSTELYDLPWQRVGYPPFSLKTLEAA